MSTLTRGNRLPDYKDYMNFVSAYRNGKKEIDEPPVGCESYSNYLEKTKTKKFGPVKPPIPSRDNVDAPRKTVKTEIFLQINDDDPKQRSAVRRTQSNIVGATKKIFEEMPTPDHPTNERKSPPATTMIQLEKSNDANHSSDNNNRSTSIVEKQKQILLQQLDKKIKTETKVEETAEIKKVETTIAFTPPPPPPLPTLQQKIENKPKTNTNNKNNQNVVTEKPKAQTNAMARKLAYGAMLDMYGAYHDKANNYVATLPRNQVKKENGLQKIIDNIAAQGGLMKLSGRSNPKQDNE